MITPISARWRVDERNASGWTSCWAQQMRDGIRQGRAAPGASTSTMRSLGVNLDSCSSRVWIGRGGRESGEGSFPSKTDFARNFADDADDVEEPETYEDAEEGQDYDDGEGGDGEEDPLYPGLYKALYAFDPEGTAEMKLEEDQIVRVIGRGGGVGWAVVDRGEADGGHALVPESYLEVVQLDEEEEPSDAA